MFKGVVARDVSILGSNQILLASRQHEDELTMLSPFNKMRPSSTRLLSFFVHTSSASANVTFMNSSKPCTDKNQFVRSVIIP